MRGRQKSREKYIARFLKRIKKIKNGCWIWKGSKFSQGYGAFWYEGFTRKAHRVSWVLFNGDPGKFCVCHKCDTRDCVNPDHLFIGTQMDNFIDAVKKGRINQTGETNHHAKLTEQQVKIIREWYGRPLSYEMLARLFGVTKSAIYDVIIRKKWKHI